MCLDKSCSKSRARFPFLQKINTARACFLAKNHGFQARPLCATLYRCKERAHVDSDQRSASNDELKTGFCSTLVTYHGLLMLTIRLFAPDNYLEIDYVYLGIHFVEGVMREAWNVKCREEAVSHDDFWPSGDGSNCLRGLSASS
jgi:hypothetical protein